MVAGLMAGVLVLAGSAAVAEENSTDPPVDPTESVSAIPSGPPSESTEAPATSTAAEDLSVEAAVPVEGQAEPEAIIGEPLTTEEPEADEPPAGAAGASQVPMDETTPASVVVDPSIDTNLENYYADAPVVVTGTGWTPGETVAVSLRESGRAGVIAQVDVVADGSGEFTKQLDLPGYVMVEANVRAQSASGKASEKIYAYRGTK